MNSLNEFGQAVKLRRADMGLTQAQVALLTGLSFPRARAGEVSRRTPHRVAQSLEESVTYARVNKNVDICKQLCLYMRATNGEGDFYRLAMNTKQLERRLKGLGAKIISGKKHNKVYLNGKQTVIPRHKEIPEQLAKVILKQLGVK